MRDLKSNLSPAHSVAPALRTAAVNGTGVDLRGYDSAAALSHCGALTDGTFTPVLQESDDNITFTDVAAADMVGSFSAISANEVQAVGYTGSKRYIRVSFTQDASPAPSTGANFGASILNQLLLIHYFMITPLSYQHHRLYGTKVIQPQLIKIQAAGCFLAFAVSAVPVYCFISGGIIPRFSIAQIYCSDFTSNCIVYDEAYLTGL